MKLSDNSIKSFNNNSRLKNRIALELNCSVYTVDRWIKYNEKNGDLTKTRILEIISEETGLSLSEILEEAHGK